MEIPSIIIKDAIVNDASVSNVSIPNVYTPEWLKNSPVVPIPRVPVTDQIGLPVIQYPGCVTAHESNEEQLKEDDPDKVKIFCDGGMPAFDPIDYNKDEIKMVSPPVEPPKINPEVNDLKATPPPPVPNPPNTETEGCPTEAQQLTAPVGSPTADGKQKITDYRLVGNQCIAIKEDLNIPEQIVANIPSAGAITTTTTIAVVATTSAIFAKPLADIALRVIKPVVKKTITKVKMALGKKPRRLSKNEVMTNRYRQSKGLGPVKTPK